MRLARLDWAAWLALGNVGVAFCEETRLLVNDESFKLARCSFRQLGITPRAEMEELLGPVARSTIAAWSIYAVQLLRIVKSIWLWKYRRRAKYYKEDLARHEEISNWYEVIATFQSKTCGKAARLSQRQRR